MIVLSKALQFGIAALFATGVMAAGTAIAEPDQGSIARGGKLYDKWYAEIKVEPPKESHKLYPSSNEKYANDPKANWRCKECHGWDGLGAQGAYGKGGHATGIKGIQGLAGGDPASVVALLKADEHGYGDKLSDRDLNDIANFVVFGQLDWPRYVDASTKTAKGDAEAGRQVYQTMCIGCHGPDGKLPTGMSPLGSLSGNPWELMHKVLNGQPAEAMPALRAIDHQISANLVAFMATLPAQ